jgi:hypothetical protein
LFVFDCMRPVYCLDHPWDTSKVLLPVVENLPT